MNQWNIYTNAVSDVKCFYFKEGKTIFHNHCFLKGSAQPLLYKPIHEIKLKKQGKSKMTPNLYTKIPIFVQISVTQLKT